MADKRMSAGAALEGVRDGMTVGVGGWGSRRKPMALVQALVRTGVRDLTVVSFGGPDVGLLCAAGRVRRLVFGFVSLDSVPLEPHFRAARQAGAIEVTELDEGMVVQGLRAAAWRLPFLPVRAGNGSDVMTANPHLATVRSPYAGADGAHEELVAMPALRLDVALLHLHRADAAGNGVCLGPDPFFDDLFAAAADRTVLSVEKVVPTSELLALAGLQGLLLPRFRVRAVVEAPGGAGFTECLPDSPRDEARQQAWVDAARDPAALAAWLEGA